MTTNQLEDPLKPAEPMTTEQIEAQKQAEKDRKAKELAERGKKVNGELKSGTMERFLGFATGLLLVAFIVLFAFVYSTMHDLSKVVKTPGDVDLAFIFASSDLITSSLLRLVAAMAGSAIAFAGLIISFYTHKEQTSLFAGTAAGTDVKPPAGGPTVSLSTYSPGIVAIVVGALVVGGSLFSKTTHDFTGETIIEHKSDQSQKQGPQQPQAQGKKPAGTEMPQPQSAVPQASASSSTSASSHASAQ